MGNAVDPDQPTADAILGTKQLRASNSSKF